MLTDIAVRGESSAIFSQHWPEQYLSQLMNYNEEALIPADRFDAKLIVVACPVDVRVYDKSSNELLAEVVQNPLALHHQQRELRDGKESTHGG